jgi:hypothetical protein
MRIAASVLLLLVSFSALSQTDFDEEDEQINYEMQMQPGQWATGFNFGVNLGFRNAQLGISNSIVLVDIALNPRIALIAKERLALGFSPDFLLTMTSSSGMDNYTYLAAAYNGMIRYYLSKNFFIEGIAGAGGGNEQFERTDGTSVKQPFRLINYSGGIGLSNFWSERLNLELLLRYKGQHGRYREEQSRFYIGGIQVSAGLNLHMLQN